MRTWRDIRNVAWHWKAWKYLWSGKKDSQTTFC